MTARLRRNVLWRLLMEDPVNEIISCTDPGLPCCPELEFVDGTSSGRRSCLER